MRTHYFHVNFYMFFYTLLFSLLYSYAASSKCEMYSNALNKNIHFHLYAIYPTLSMKLLEIIKAMKKNKTINKKIISARTQIENMFNVFIESTKINPDHIEVLFDESVNTHDINSKLLKLHMTAAGSSNKLHLFTFIYLWKLKITMEMIAILMQKTSW